jgi:PIN domain nuclease of toxin-antitoxin system
MGHRVKELLVDTHVVLWWFLTPELLSARAKATLCDQGNHLMVSAASAWEMAIKAKRGKLDIPDLLADLPSVLEEEGFIALSIKLEHALEAGALPEHHKDPFDRMLIAQARVEKAGIISNDSMFDRYGVPRIW